MGWFSPLILNWEHFESQLKFYPNGINDYPHSFNNEKNRLIESMKQCGNEYEQKVLIEIFKILECFIPTNLTVKEHWRCQNLLNNIIYLWCIGKISSDNENTKRLFRIMKETKPEKDPRLHLQLFPRTLDILNNADNKARRLEDFLIRREVGRSYAKKYVSKNKTRAINFICQRNNTPFEHLKNVNEEYLANEIFGLILMNKIQIPKKELRLPKNGNLCWKNQKLSLKPNTSLKEEQLKSYRFMLEQIKRITLIEALKKANKKTFFSPQIFSDKEFDETFSKIEQGYKDWNRGKNKRKLKKSGTAPLK